MKKIVYYLLPALFVWCLIACSDGRAEGSYKPVQVLVDSIEFANTKAKALEALIFCRKKKMDTNFCILANMHTHSGKIRLYVWDLRRNKAIDSGLLSHGCGNNPWSGTTTKEKAVFSNADGSHCSSLGKYSIGKRGYSQWGINVNYELHGLEATNSNALIRQVVLHGWNVVGDKPIYPQGTPEGWGCPAVSNLMMARLDRRLKKSNVPVLLWMFQ